MEREMAMGHIYGQMGINMKENGKRKKGMVMELSLGQMGTRLRGLGKTGKQLVKQYLHG